MSTASGGLTAAQSEELDHLNQRFASGFAASCGPVLNRRLQATVLSTELIPLSASEQPETDLVIKLEVQPLGRPAAVFLIGALVAPANTCRCTCIRWWRGSMYFRGVMGRVRSSTASFQDQKNISCIVGEQ